MTYTKQLEMSCYCVLCDDATVLLTHHGERYISIHEACWQKVITNIVVPPGIRRKKQLPSQINWGTPAKE
jgi:hypothetical protein